MPEPRHHYLVSLQTLAHMDTAYIGCAPGDDPRASRASAWYITKKPSEAYDFGSFGLARDFQRQLQEGEACGLKNDGHLWHVTPRSEPL
jgi:hypothetical protein